MRKEDIMFSQALVSHCPDVRANFGILFASHWTEFDETLRRWSLPATDEVNWFHSERNRNMDTGAGYDRKFK